MNKHSEEFPPELTKVLSRKKELLGLSENLTHRQVESAFHQRSSGRYIGDVIFGASDGLVTTFAVVAGATGAGLAPSVVIIIGFANLLADGLSMGLGNYLGKKTEADYNTQQWQKERWEVENFPEIEKHETREIFKRWGFAGADLDRAVEVISQNHDAWIDLMMKEELSILDDPDQHPSKHGFATFCAFAIAGFVPLLPYLFGYEGSVAFLASIVLTGLTMFFTGAARMKISAIRFWRGGIEMLIVGAIASGAAYYIGDILSRLFG